MVVFGRCDCKGTDENDRDEALDVDILNAAIVEGRETAARGLVDSRVSLYTGYNSVDSMYVCIYVCTAAE